MTAADLARSAASDDSPPAGIADSLKALWLAKAGRWDEAHDLRQEIEGSAGAWIHAYLHREEGDLSNAAYWYARAGRDTPGSSVTLEAEWLELAGEFL